jgi:uncharacterized protein
MSHDSFTRRGFLSGIAAVGGTTLLSQPAHALASKDDRGATAAVHPVAEKVPWKARAFPMGDVRLTAGPFMEAMETNRGYLYSLPNDRLAYSFRVTAGIPTDATPLGGWEAPDGLLRGHYIGHYLSACALLYGSTGDTEILAKANELVTILAACQQKDGYLGAYDTKAYDNLRLYDTPPPPPGTPRPTGAQQRPRVWAPFYTYHKILAGFIDMYELTGNRQALVVATRMADWADAYSKSFTPDQWQNVLGSIEHGGMNEAAFNLYGITGNPKYKDLAYRFEHKKFFDTLAAHEDKLDKVHANTNIPKVIGAARGYELTGDERYQNISQYFWKEVVSDHIYATGGTSNGEIWHAPDAIASELGGAAEECCCSYNMMKLTRHLFGQEPDAKLFDYYERLLYNVRLGTQDRFGMLMYYVSLKPGLYKTFGTPFNAFWCCTGTGSEEFAKLTDSIYFHDNDAVYVNLFLPSVLNWKERGLRLSQKTKFPEEQTTTLTMENAPKQKTALKIRVPYWATSGVTVKVNGQDQQVAATPSSYMDVSRSWANGDVVEITLPMSLHIAPAPDDKQVQAAMYGPLVLAARMGYDGLTTSMIYGGSGPRGRETTIAMPEVDGGEMWLEKTDSDRRYPLVFKTKGTGTSYVLVPLYKIVDERYSVYLKNNAKA